MVVRFFTLLLIISTLSACSVSKTEEISKIVLLAPFEGQYREIGYNALYSARLAISESDVSGVDLLAVDDGGTIELATQRILALNQDPNIVAVIALGQFSTSVEAQTALNNTPMIVVGFWDYSANTENVYNLSHPDIDTFLNFGSDLNDLSTAYSSIIGGEILSLYQTPLLFEYSDIINVYSSSSLPDDDFRARYLASAEFVPEPNLLTTLTYDATQIVVQAIQTNTPISDIEYEGINGLFDFQGGYWSNAPIRLYEYENSTLVEIFD